MALVSLGDYEQAARERLAPEVWEFIDGGAQDEVTKRRNRAVFEEIRLRPFRFTDVRTRDLSTTVLGERIAFPVFIAPTGVHGHAHPDGELATARAAAAAGTIMSLGTGGSRSIEEVAAATSGPKWFQLYHTGRELSEMLIRRAEKNGYKAVCVTVDVPIPSLGKEKDRRNGFKPLIGIELANYMGEIAGVGLVSGRPESKQWIRPPQEPITWDDVAWLRSITKLPLVMKGVLTGEDAADCVRHGIEGIVVSNHGGRVLDGTVSSIEVLEEVVDAVNGRAEVYLDSGVRRGSDVVKALALGARACAIGRPFWWGLAVDGEAGVRQVLEILRQEIDHTVAYCGRTTIAELGRDLVRSPGAGAWARTPEGSGVGR